MEALRAFGYTLQAAVADLVDNSLTAEANSISLQFHWEGEDSWIALSDDGLGMDEVELREAMRPGTHNPSDVRSSTDLGRFGLGLKTASLSQCRSLTVLSARAGHPVFVRRWDLDHIADVRDWQLLRSGTSVSDALLENWDEGAAGTIVIWQKLDRILDVTGVAGQIAEDRFLELVDAVEGHLALVFHRFLTGPGRVHITINGRAVQPWDPFLSGHSATQELTTEDHPLFGSVMGVVPYVLPHHSKLTPAEHKQAAGPQGWNAHQGFYVYRNRRLIVAGSWLGLGLKKEEHYKLARILVDIPNSMDDRWHLDVRKSSARPPGVIREDLRRIAKLTRQRAVEVYRHRGKTVARNSALPAVHAWNRHVRDGHVYYRINREYPLVAQLLDSARSTIVQQVLRVLEETIPVQTIYIDASERPEEQIGPFELVTDSEMDAFLYDLLREMVEKGWDVEAAAQQLIALEPFQDHGEALGRCIAVIQSEAGHGHV